MSTRRQFLKQMSLGAVAGAIGFPVLADPLFSRTPLKPLRELKIALLADSHLVGSSPETIAAKNLLQAVEEINAQNPPVNLVFFTGDLIDDGEYKSLELGREILAKLHAPCWLVPGEQDTTAAAGNMWQDRSDNIIFSFSYQGIHFCGCNTICYNSGVGTTNFKISPRLHRRLESEFASVPTDIPLLIFTHAPLYRLFQPWQWWTKDSELLYNLLKSRKEVYLVHGHVHQNISLQHQNLIFQGLRSTAWPLPDVRIGISSNDRSVKTYSRAGCGWMLFTINSRDGAVACEDNVWV